MKSIDIIIREADRLLKLGALRGAAAGLFCLVQAENHG